MGLTHWSAAAARHGAKSVGAPGTRAWSPELRTLLDRRQVITRRCERAQVRGIIAPDVFPSRHRKPIGSGSGAPGGRPARYAGRRPRSMTCGARRSETSSAAASRSVAMKLTGHKTEASVTEGRSLSG